MMGSIEGSFFYGIGGYTLPFYVNSGLLVVLMPFIIKYLPTNE